MIAVGASLVVATWLAAALVLITVGLLPSMTVVRSATRLTLIRASLWWGLLLTSIFALGASLLFALSSPWVAFIGLIAVVALGIPGWLLVLRRTRWSPPLRPRGGLIVLLGTAILVTAYFAVAALGPVTNYDSGLYHLGAIRYAAEYPAIPGLANLYFPFGYGTAQFPLAALFTNGPWGMEGYRLLNGLILTLAGLDLLIRMLVKRRGPGFYVLAVGLVATWVPMVALSDYWVTSPSQDSAALVLAVVTSAYLTDAVHGRKGWLSLASTAVVISTTLTLIRPTMGAYLLGLVLVILVLLVHRKPPLRTVAAPALIPIGLGVFALALTTVRDRILSGWAQYPLSVFPFDVPWRADEPSSSREATLGYHRNPADLWNSIDGWDWVGPWIANRAQQWETYELLALLTAAVLLLLVAARRSTNPRLISHVVLSTLPSLGATAVWWLATPPSYRFAWGALFTLATVPIGWALWSMNSSARVPTQTRLIRPDRIVALAMLSVLVVTAYSALFRLDWVAINQPGTVNIGVSIPVNFAPVVSVPLSEVNVAGGLTLLVPLESDQCWGNYPLCTPEPSGELRPLTTEWPKGLTVN